jgi:hypothetical protein
MITVASNLDYLIDPVRIYVGDLQGTTYSDAVVRTALVYGVKALQTRWNSRYLIFESGMASGLNINTPYGTCVVEDVPNPYDVFRNCYHTFTSEDTPVIDQTDETPIILSAAIILRRISITSSSSAYLSWSTPDLSVSNIQGSKNLTALYDADVKMLDAYFKGRLAAPVKSTFPIAQDGNVFPIIYIQNRQG